jgi:hypothetical protein
MGKIGQVLLHKKGVHSSALHPGLCVSGKLGYQIDMLVAGYIFSLLTKPRGLYYKNVFDKSSFQVYTSPPLINSDAVKILDLTNRHSWVYNKSLPNWLMA